MLDDSLLLRAPWRSERDPLIGPFSSDHNAAFPVELIKIKEELVAPVSAEADDVPLVNHERYVRVFDWRGGRCDVLPHVYPGLEAELSDFAASVA